MSTRTEDIRKRERLAFHTVMESYDQIRSVVGNTQALDYAKMKMSGSGPKFHFNDHTFQLIDFVADVQKVMNDNLNAEEKEFIKPYMDGTEEFNWDVQTDWFMRLSERIGRVFLGRHMCPVNKYFQTVKK